MSVSSFSEATLGNAFSKRNQFALPSENPAAISSDGTVVTSGGYEYHTFTSSGTLTVNKAGKMEVLLVGGGGASTNNGGGGGAGQVFNDEIFVESGSYPVVVGAGAAISDNTIGGHSYIGSGPNPGSNIAVAFGGSTGNTGYGQPVTRGGASGAGGSIYESGGYPLLNDTFYGRNGGNGVYVEACGGGGGMAVAGGNASTNLGGSGGNGTSDYSAWGLATSTGENVSGTVYYAGGGGGGRYQGQGTVGVGGLGGGGRQSAGDANTGGGGSDNNTGGSGLVIVRIAV